MRWLLVLAIVSVLAAAWYAARKLAARQRARERLDQGLAADEPRQRRRLREAPFLRRYRWLPWVGALVAFAALYALGLLLPYCVAFALLVGLLGSQLEAYLADRRLAKIENQLADSIDLMVGALGAGTGLAGALDAAIYESAEPLRSQLADVQARIRFGDDPRDVFRALAERVGTETFLLFASTLSTHWEVGGALTPTLSSVGRTIRDRIEVARRIRSNITQSQVSTIAVLALTYFIALVMWRTNRPVMVQFLTTTTGGWFVAATILLQGVGIVWMALISRPKF